MTRLIGNPHWTHDWHPDDDIIACDMCGVRIYNNEAALPCTKAERRIHLGCSKCGDRFWTPNYTTEGKACDECGEGKMVRISEDITEHNHAENEWYPDTCSACEDCPHPISTIHEGWTGCTICGKTAADIAKENETI